MICFVVCFDQNAINELIAREVNLRSLCTLGHILSTRNPYPDHSYMSEFHISPDKTPENIVREDILVNLQTTPGCAYIVLGGVVGEIDMSILPR